MGADTIGLQDLIEGLASLDLPAPIAIEEMPHGGVHLNYRLRFAPIAQLPPMMLRILNHRPGYDTLDREKAALELARAKLPVVQKFWRLPLPPGGPPAAISELLPGTNGHTFYKRRPETGPVVAQMVGRVLSLLDEIPQPTFAMTCANGRFVARSDNWTTEWRHYAESWVARAQRGGSDLGVVFGQLRARVKEKSACLHHASQWRLVHHDLHPANLLLDGEGNLTGVVDWEGAIVGDPLCEWAQVLEWSDNTVAHVVEGFSRHRLEKMLEGTSLLS